MGEKGKQVLEEGVPLEDRKNFTNQLPIKVIKQNDCLLGEETKRREGKEKEKEAEQREAQKKGKKEVPSYQKPIVYNSRVSTWKEKTTERTNYPQQIKGNFGKDATQWRETETQIRKGEKFAEQRHLKRVAR